MGARRAFALALLLVASCGSRTGGVPPARPEAAVDGPRTDLLRPDLWSDAPVTPVGWARAAGGAGVDRGSDIAVDGQGNVYVTGDFSGSASFGPHVLLSKGAADIFLARLDPDGTWLWTSSAGGMGDDKGCSVALQGGLVAVAGLFHDQVALAGSSLVSKGSSDVLVAGYNSDGQARWAVRAGGPGGDWGWQVQSDGEDGVLVCGKYNGQGTFGSFVLPAVGGDEAFVVRLDDMGGFTWAQRAGWYGGEAAWGVAEAGHGSAFVAGKFEWTVDFGSTTLGSTGAEDIFLAKYASGGGVEWAVGAGGNGQDWGWAVAPDNAGGVYLTGFFEGLAYFGSASVESKGSTDVYVARYSAAGQQMWVSAAGGSEADRGYDVVADGTGAVVVGCFADQIQLGETVLSSKGDWDVFVARLDAAGQWDWAISAGGAGPDRPAAAAMGPGRTLHVVGQFAGSSTFGGTVLTAAGKEDVFVWKLVLP